MGADVVTKEQMKHSLDDWYRVMLQQDFLQSKFLKEEIESKINDFKEEKNISLFYSLLEFRYQVLVDSLSVTNSSFDRIDSLYIVDDNVLTYYYHFFKAIKETLVTNYKAASEEFEKAELMLGNITNPVEHAEFYYRLGYYYYQSYQPILGIDNVNKAREEFERHSGYELSVALCKNIYGLCSVDLKQFSLAEESFDSALNIFQHQQVERYILMVKSNLGWLYGSQNLSELSIRHISEVVEKSPKHYKGVFTLAEENYKLNRVELANEFIELGLKVCNELKNQEFQYRFMILKELNKKSNTAELERVVLEGISYFEKESLWDCVEEYTEKLAIRFYEESNDSKASEYFYMSNKASKKYLEKGALK
ncbi:hypothetical protein [Bacillus paranthracis]|uniref:response regulator aspartate phosphatase n=1 Tax=Bacillus paranthracis TaxID=2026186 RepID=UPI0022548758|nr:hypothetical protein [Bacillus paranthracis]